MIVKRILAVRVRTTRKLYKYSTCIELRLMLNKIVWARSTEAAIVHGGLYPRPIKFWKFSLRRMRPFLSVHFMLFANVQKFSILDFLSKSLASASVSQTLLPQRLNARAFSSPSHTSRH